MLKQFIQAIERNKLFNKKQKLLVAASGGVDSMTLCDLLLKANYNFSIAHCNFKLRGKEAEYDQLLVEQFCEDNKLKCYTVSFKTDKYAKSKGLSIQMAARELRYNFFKEIMTDFGYDYLITAHHLDDNIETFFINLLRGTGIRGLSGIQLKTGNIVRPLLSFNKKEIEKYASNNKVSYREDKSNKEDKYVRNYIRLNIIPQLKKVNPSFDETMKLEFDFINQYNIVIDEWLEIEKRRVLLQDKLGIKISIKKLIESKAPKLVLFEILKAYNFNSKEIDKVLEACNGISGKIFKSDSYELIKDRDFLILNKIISKEKVSYKVQANLKSDYKGLKINPVKKFSKSDGNKVAYINGDKLIFPLKIRNWKEADKFKPIGLNGFKKLSDFFINLKLNKFEKSEVLILENGNGEIVWVMNYRMDDRYKITSSTKKVLKFSLVD